MSGSNWNEPAPGGLEGVRRFLNTWKIPDGVREPVDELPGLLADAVAWEERFPGWMPGSREDAKPLAELRDELRGALEAPVGWTGRLSVWFEKHPFVARISEEGNVPVVRYEPTPAGGIPGHVLAAVAEGIREGTWSRLKVCPDCRWVFYDRSRSRTRVWCGMYAGEGGRACGTIAKVRRYRRKRRGTAPA